MSSNPLANLPNAGALTQFLTANPPKTALDMRRTIVCGTADALIAQARALREALTLAGVAHEYVEDEGMPHGYAQMEFLPATRPAIERMVKFLDARMR